MGFWIFMVIMNLLLPVTMIGFGRLFLKQAPGAINWAFGYRTEMSMKNKDTWDFAHNYIGKLWYRIGLFLLPLSIIPLLFVLGKDKDTVGNLGAAIVMIQMVFLIVPIFPTERALKKTFDKKGNRRQGIEEMKE